MRLHTDDSGARESGAQFDGSSAFDQNHQERLENVRALLSVVSMEAPPRRRFGRFAWIGGFAGVLALLAAFANFAPVRAIAGGQSSNAPVLSALSPIGQSPMPSASASYLPPINVNTATINTATAKTPIIALMIDDVGASPQWSQAALALPANVTLSVLPNTPAAPQWADRAKQNGHEVWLHMPMEPLGLENPGAGALLNALPAKRNQRRLEQALARVPGALGINNHMGSRFTSCKKCVANIAAMVGDHGLLFLDSMTSTSSKAANIMQQAGVPVVRRDVFLDDDNAAPAIVRQMRLAEQMARDEGVVFVIAHPRPNTMKALQNWQNELAEAGIEMAPMSVAIARKYALQREEELLSAGL